MSRSSCSHTWKPAWTSSKKISEFIAREESRRQLQRLRRKCKRWPSPHGEPRKRCATRCAMSGLRAECRKSSLFNALLRRSRARFAVGRNNARLPAGGAGGGRGIWNWSTPPAWPPRRPAIRKASLRLRMMISPPRPKTNDSRAKLRDRRVAVLGYDPPARCLGAGATHDRRWPAPSRYESRSAARAACDRRGRAHEQRDRRGARRTLRAITCRCLGQRRRFDGCRGGYGGALPRKLACGRCAHQEAITMVEIAPAKSSSRPSSAAIDELGHVVGAVYTDDLLERIFSRLCIGK